MKLKKILIILGCVIVLVGAGFSVFTIINLNSKLNEAEKENANLSAELDELEEKLNENIDSASDNEQFVSQEIENNKRTIEMQKDLLNRQVHITAENVQVTELKENNRLSIKNISADNKKYITIPADCKIYMADNIGFSEISIDDFIEKIKSDLESNFFDDYTFVYTYGDLAQIYQGKNPPIEVSTKERDKIYLADYAIDFYQMEFYDMQPACGPLAKLNTYGIEGDQENLSIISQNDYYTKIMLVGYIPTWCISDNKKYPKDSQKGNMYALEDTPIYLSPEEDGYERNILDKGYVVKVLYEYEDWYYISVLTSFDSCEVGIGWVKAETLGKKSDFDSVIGLGVYIPTGTTDVNDPNKIINEKFLNWGIIRNETENTYEIDLPGATTFEIEKDKVSFVE